MADPPGLAATPSAPPASTPPPQPATPPVAVVNQPPPAPNSAAVPPPVTPVPLPDKEKKEEKDRLPKENDEITTDSGKKYKLGPVLGDGGYGTVFLSSDEEVKIAVKTEKFSKSQLKIEIIVLKAAMIANCKHFCELIDCGTRGKEFDFMMITLLGKDLHKLRCELPDRKFSINTVLRIGIQTLKACEELHRIGFVSRDVKPGNFAPGVKQNRQSRLIFMYDFGLARKYVDKNNQVIPSRKEVGWRGTTRYGSLNAHKRLDLGRRDDLESWFYGLVEMTRGTLPWRNVVERNHVQRAKEASRTTNRTQFLFETPAQYDKIFTLIDSYSFESAPDYQAMSKLLVEAREERQLRDREHWDWEDETVSTTMTTTITSFSDKELRAKHEKSLSDNRHKVCAQSNPPSESQPQNSAKFESNCAPPPIADLFAIQGLEMPPKLRARSSSRSRTAIVSMPSPAPSSSSASKAPEPVVVAKSPSRRGRPRKSETAQAATGRQASKSATPRNRTAASGARSRSRSRGRPSAASQAGASSSSAAAAAPSSASRRASKKDEVVSTIEVADDDDDELPVATTPRTRGRPVRDLTQDPPTTRSRAAVRTSPRQTFPTVEAVEPKKTSSGVCATACSIKSTVVAGFNKLVALIAVIFNFVLSPYFFIRNEYREQKKNGTWRALLFLFCVLFVSTAIFYVAFPETSIKIKKYTVTTIIPPVRDYIYDVIEGTKNIGRGFVRQWNKIQSYGEKLRRYQESQEL